MMLHNNLSWNKICFFLMSTSIILFIGVQQYNISNFITGSRIDDELYVVQPDTRSYLVFKLDYLLHPFASFRSPGYPLFLKAFTYGKISKIDEVYKKMSDYTPDELWDYGKGSKGNMAALLFKEEGLASSLNSVVIVQFLILCFSIIFLYYSIIPKDSSFLDIIVYGLFLLFCFYLVPPPSMRWIMTESLGQPILFICIASVLSFHKTKKICFLYYGCFLAVYGFLIRPSSLIIILIITLYLLYLIYRSKFRNCGKYVACVFILFLGYSYIFFLSAICGSPCFGTIQYAVSLRRIAYFLEEKDINHMPTQRSKIIAEKLLNEKNKIYDQLDTDFKKRYQNQSVSPALRYFYIAETLALKNGKILWDCSRLWRDNETNDFYIDLTRITKEIEKGLSINHSKELFDIRLWNFLTTLGLDKHYKTGILANKGFLYSSMALIILISAIVLCKDTRFLIIILSSTHMLAALSIAYSHIMLDRYYAFTEQLYILSIIIATFSLCIKAVHVIRCRFRVHF